MFHFTQIHSSKIQQQNTNKISHDPDINLDFEENSPFQEGIMSETFQRLDKSFFSESKRALGSYK